MADMLTHERPLPFFTEKGKHQKTDLCPLSKGALQIRLKDGKGQVVFFRSSLKNLHLKPLPSFILSVVIFVRSEERRVGKERRSRRSRWREKKERGGRTTE